MGVKPEAVRYMLMSAFSFAIMDILLKYLDQFSGWQLMFFRAMGSVFICTYLLFRYKINFLGNNRRLLVLRGVVGSTSMLLFLLAISYLPIGTTISLRYLSPIFAAIFAIILLRERIIPVQWVFITISFLGVIILKGFDSRVSTIGLILVLFSAFFSGLVYIIVRKLGESDHPLVIVNYFMVIATLIGGLGSVFIWRHPHGLEWLLLGSLGIFGFLGQYFMTKGLQIEEASRMAPLKYMEVVFVLILAFAFLGETYSMLSLLGILMIISGLAMNLKVKKS